MIEKTDYGFRLTFSDSINAEEMGQWLQEARAILPTVKVPFGVLVDMRSLKPLKSDAQAHMEAGQKLFRERGMARSVVILNDLITTMQFQRIAKQTGINQWERYLNALTTPDWETKAMEWIQDGIDPDGR